MSRSVRKTKITGITTCESEKIYKQKANRQYRHKVKQSINKGKEVLPEIKEVSDVWSFGKDGKRYYSGLDKKDMRK
ncbi:MAG: hypothetical protein ABSG15_13170 [FCB group bacterium]|jgi:hypothetical protein